MPVLIRELLFAIGKKLVKDGDSVDVIKVALSGKEALEAMKNVFASVSTLEIDKKFCAIGWGDPCCKFGFRNDKQYLKFLMHCIGNSVADLRVKCSTFADTHQTIYNPILNKMLARKLRSFSLLVDGYAVRKFFGEFLLQFSSALKNVKIPSEFMTRTFRDIFNLDSVIVLDSGNKNLLLFCCKTTSLSYGGPLPFAIFNRFVTKNLQHSTPLFSTKKLIFGPRYLYSQHLNYGRLRDLMKYFPELEYVKFNNALLFFIDDVRRLIHSYTEMINESIKAPAKIVVEFFKYNRSMGCPTLDSYKADYLDNTFEYDEAVSAFFCFRKNVPMAGSEVRVFEVLFPKK
uniref:Uncharacterized protein n=1 Tax=Panagrolaimus sp. PS1159 TaxID=55785 RepID=A0AC35GV51_9BILA